MPAPTQTTTVEGFFGTADIRTVWDRGREERPYLFLYDPSSDLWVLDRTSHQHTDQMFHADGVEPDHECANRVWRGYYFAEAQVLYIYPRWHETHQTPPSPETMRSIRSRLRVEFGAEPTEEYLIGDDPWLKPGGRPFISEEVL